MSTFFIRTSSDDGAPFGQAQIVPFTADTLAHAKLEAQSMSSLLGVNLILEDVSTSPTAGATRFKYTPVVASTANINLTSGVAHK